jgi:hypothetical protein
MRSCSQEDSLKFENVQIAGSAADAPELPSLRAINN